LDEDNYVLGLKRERNQLCVLGYPALVARISDCTLKLRGFGITAEQREIRDNVYGEDWDNG